MKTVTIPVAYMPLVDAAPLIVAQDLGFAEAGGLSLDLIAAPSSSSVRDMLAFARADAAHMLSPVPVAMAMGLGGVTLGGLVLLGAALFMASDAILGSEKFLMPESSPARRLTSPAVWVLYYAGQVLITLGLLA